MSVEDATQEEQKTASPVKPAQEEQEQYLFLYIYRIEKQEYRHLDYFRDEQEAKAYYAKTSPPYIESISLEQYPQGYMGVNDFYPYKKSVYDRLAKEDMMPKSKADLKAKMKLLGLQ